MPTQIFKTIVVLVLLIQFGETVPANMPATSAYQINTEERININTASVTELMRLPGIGPKLAERIIAHRTKHGVFKRPQDIVIVRGFSANRYRQIAHLIRT